MLSTVDAVCDAEAAPFRCLDPYLLPAECTDAELLTTTLGPATRASCDALTAAHEDFRVIGQLLPAELTGHGFTANAINRLAAVFEIAKRYGEHEFNLGAVFRGSADIYAHFRERMAAEICELFYAVLLDKHRKLRDVLASKGSLTAAIVHNHPSGDPTPSREDLEITRRLREVGELIGIRVLDHIVIGNLVDQQNMALFGRERTTKRAHLDVVLDVADVAGAEAAVVRA